MARGSLQPAGGAAVAKGVATGTACCGCCPRHDGGHACAPPCWLSQMLEAESALMLPPPPLLLAVSAAADASTGVVPVASGGVTPRSPAVQRRALARLPLLPLRTKKEAAPDSVCFMLRFRAVRRWGDSSLCALPWRTDGSLR